MKVTTDILRKINQGQGSLFIQQYANKLILRVGMMSLEFVIYAYRVFDAGFRYEILEDGVYELYLNGKKEATVKFLNNMYAYELVLYTTEFPEDDYTLKNGYYYLNVNINGYTVKALKSKDCITYSVAKAILKEPVHHEVLGPIDEWYMKLYNTRLKDYIEDYNSKLQALLNKM